MSSFTILSGRGTRRHYRQGHGGGGKTRRYQQGHGRKMQMFKGIMKKGVAIGSKALITTHQANRKKCLARYIRRP